MEYLAVKTVNTQTPDCPALRGQNTQNNREGRQYQMDKENFKQYFVCNPHRMGLLAANCFCTVLHGLKVVCIVTSRSSGKCFFLNDQVIE